MGKTKRRLTLKFKGKIKRDKNMKIGIVTPDLNTDTMSAELFEAVSQRASAYLINPEEISAKIGDKQEIWLGKNRVGVFDALILRRLSQNGDVDYQYQVLQQCENDGLLIVNPMKSLEIAESKFLTSMLLSQYGLPVPEMVICQTQKDIAAFFKKFGEIVIKPLYGDLGRDIYRLKSKKDIKKADKLLENEGAVIAQQFIKSKGKDYRIFVVGDYVVGAIERQAKNGWVTNIFNGGKAKKITPDREMRDLSIKSAQIAGLDYCGIDIICQNNKYYILEINGSPAWEGISKATHRNIPKDIVSHVIRKIQVRKQMPFFTA
jgi:tetrahydromethanopterin:alpha-L-glutamate ligase